MKKLTLITALLLATSPVAAQSGQQALGAGGQTNNSPLPDTGIVCQQEMTATFCNAPTSPNIGGFGSSRGSTSSEGSGTGSGSGTERGSRKQHFVHLTLRKLSSRLTNCATQQTTSKKKLARQQRVFSGTKEGSWGLGERAAPSIPLSMRRLYQPS